MTNRLDSILSNIRPTFVQRNAGERPGEVKIVQGADVRQLQNNLESAKGMDVKDILQKYDLRDITKTEMFSFVSILSQKKAVSDETINRLFEHTTLAFEDQPDGQKTDFLAFLDGMASKVFSGPDPISENGKNILNTVIAEANSIDFARKTGADRITIDLKI